MRYGLNCLLAWLKHDPRPSRPPARFSRCHCRNFVRRAAGVCVGGDAQVIEIEKNIPMPKNQAGMKSIYPIAQMEIGDSFLADLKKRGGMTIGFQRHGFRCATRQEGDKVRVWRIA